MKTLYLIIRNATAFAFFRRKHCALVILLLLGITACEPEPAIETSPTENRLRAEATQNVISNDTDNDSTETSTSLGYKLPNPYTVINMRQAYKNVHGGNWDHITANKKYVRFKPTTKEQLLTLTETLDLDLFEEPLDYNIAQDGDSYQDPTIPLEQITWLYTVVPTSFVFPSGVQYELLASVHVPATDNGAVEAEAERLVGLNADGDGLVGGGPMTTAASSNGETVGTQDFDFTCAPGYEWSEELQRCVEICPSGFYFDPNTGVCAPNAPPVFTPTIGNLSVEDTQLETQNLRNVRVVAKRWFKIERMYTDNSGNFNSTRKFKNKVKLIVKFKNSDASVRGVRGARLWQMLLPIQKKFGPLKGSEINNFEYTFTRRTELNSKGTRNWVAATTHNAVQQFRDYSVSEGTGALPSNLKIMLTNWGVFNAKAAPLFSVRWIDDIGAAFISTFVATAAHPIAGGLNALASILKRQIDITYCYNVPGNLRSDEVVETIFHELAHATLYRKAGSNWYGAVVDGTIQEATRIGLGEYSPYGDGHTTNSGIIAVNEGWAYHFGNFLANRQYGVEAGCIQPQSFVQAVCSADSPTPYLEALERFNPGLQDDVHRWIPKGIFQDLRDNTQAEINTPSLVDDQASDFTNAQLFRAIESDVRFPQAYRDRLLQQTGSAQFTQVTNLFNQYGYR